MNEFPPHDDVRCTGPAVSWARLFARVTSPSSQSSAEPLNCPYSVFLAEGFSLSFFLHSTTQPAPFTTRVIPAVLPAKGLR